MFVLYTVKEFMKTFQRPTRAEAYDIIKSLVEKYEAQKASYQANIYDEAQTRQDFIDRFFEALGWDIHNQNSEIETLREVTVEYKLKVGSSTKKPDYAFRTNRQIQFFVEAKKPAVSLMFERDPANQVREYGWNGSANISIATNFAEFSVYDCTKKVTKRDGATTGRLKYIAYTDFLKEFDFLWDTFAYQNVLNGSIRTFAEAKIDLKKAEPVDEAFLQALNDWREYLATNIAQRNKQLDEEDINFSVQMLIDRIVFLRVCEDRNIEPNEQLLQIAKSKGDIYQHLFEVFKTSDQKYNSGIFDFKKDTITASLSVDNKVIKRILLEFYNDAEEGIGRFNFAMIPIEILGYAYEQFLGKSIILEKTGKAVIVEKYKTEEESKKGKASETRKVGGVYYTPSYIVDYIVENTVGKAVEGKTPEEVSKIKILDPSCGSGSFLIGAYQFLLDWHLRYYTQNPPKNGKYKKENPLSPDGKYLTSIEKKRILLNNIFGVDIDLQAVEVSKLSLLLKALEDETVSSIKTSLDIFKERVLPTIDGNVQSGNSLIAPDFYDDGLFLTPKEERKINAFEWEGAFSDVFKQGGFDCIIGNPPYRTLQLGKKQASQEELFLDYYKRKYNRSYDYKVNLYALFIEKSTLLLKKEGSFSCIVPNTFFNAHQFTSLRKYLVQTYRFRFFLDLRYKVFEQAETGGNAIFVVENKDSDNQNIPIYTVNNLEDFKNPAIDFITKDRIMQDVYCNLTKENSYYQITNKINQINTEMLKNLAKIYQGIITGNNDKYLSKTKQGSEWEKIIRGRDVNRYSLNFSDNYVYYVPKELWSNTNINMFKVKEKIISRQTSDRLVATLDTDEYFTLDSTHVIHLKGNFFDLKYLLALFNSKILNYLYQSQAKEKGRVFAQVKKVNLDILPIKTIDFNNVQEKTAHDDLVKLVDTMLVLQMRLKSAKLPNDKRQFQQRIDRTENQIDKIVYELYNLTQSEIDLIENA
jgi:hypothetical protein